MISYELILPDDFEEYAWEIESKGWFNGAIAAFGRAQYKVVFYDPIRLAQEIEDELSENSVFLEENLLVIKSVDRKHMEKAIEHIAKAGEYKSMVMKD